MSDILSIPFGRVITGTVMGPLKASKLYIKSRIAVRDYEKKNNVVPLKNMRKKTYKMNDKEIDLSKEIRNPLVALIQKNRSTATDVYFDENDIPFLSCSYQVEIGVVKKNTKMICNCIHSNAKTHKSYYYLSCEQIHNLITDHTEEFMKDII